MVRRKERTGPRFGNEYDDFGKFSERGVESIYLADIDVGERYRTPTKESIDRMAMSMKEIGLQSPICIRGIPVLDKRGEELGLNWVLVAGATRLAAAKQLGWEKIDAFAIFDSDDIDSKLREIAENLHRTELTAQERAEQITDWVRLRKQRNIRQLDEKEDKRGRPTEGKSDAAKELGMSEPAVRRAVKIGGLSEEAKQVAQEEGLDDNQAALLEAAEKETPEEQVDHLKNRDKIKAAEYEKRITTDSQADDNPPNKIVPVVQYAEREDPEPIRPVVTITSPDPDDGLSTWDRLVAAWEAATIEEQDRLLTDYANIRDIPVRPGRPSTIEQMKAEAPAKGANDDIPATPAPPPAAAADAGPVPEFLRR